MRKISLLVGIVALSAVSAAASSAQAQDRKGWYVDGGANYSAPSQSIEQGGVSVSDSKGGAGFVIGLGMGLNNSLRLGVQFDYLALSNVFSNDLGSGTDGKYMLYTAVGTWYPSPMKNFWARLNLGYGSMKFSNSGESAQAGGFAGGIGVGYDWMVGKGGFAVTPYLSYMDLFKTGDFGGALSGESITGKIGTFQVGVTIGYKH